MGVRQGHKVRCPYTAKEYCVVGHADELFPGRFKHPSNCEPGSRLHVLVGFELEDTWVLKDTRTLRDFILVHPEP